MTDAPAARVDPVDRARDQVDAILWEWEQECARDRRRARRLRAALAVIYPDDEQWKEDE